MIRGNGGVSPSAYSQTIKGQLFHFWTGLKLLIETSSGPFLVSRTGDEGWTLREDRVLKFSHIRKHKGCLSILTAGRWSWKSKSAKECVTTHLPNWQAPKMDSASVRYLCFTNWKHWVGRRECLYRRFSVKKVRAAFSADLGGSSNYSFWKNEDWGGEGFHVNSICAWVRRF
jgi:hypothetical protein